MVNRSQTIVVTCNTLTPMLDVRAVIRLRVLRGYIIIYIYIRVFLPFNLINIL